MPPRSLRGSSRRKPKARAKALFDLAHDQHEGITTRARLNTAYRVHILRLAAGRDEEETPEEIAGAWLDAQFADEIHAIATQNAGT